MIKIERSIQLNWTLSSTAFEDINKNSFVNYSRPLSSSVRAVNTMVAADEEMRFNLPTILGVSPESKDANWLDVVSNYWHNFSLEIPMGGKKFNTSLIFDLSDPIRKEYIKDILDNYLPKTKKVAVEGDEKETKDVDLSIADKEKAFVEYVMKNVKENMLYRYCRPENIEEYLAWRFCLISSVVGNSPDEMVKEGSNDELRSTRIKFYMIDEGEIVKRKDRLNKLRDKAIMNYAKVLSSKEADVDTLLVALDLVSSLKDLKDLSISDKRSAIYDVCNSNPERFNATYDSKVLSDIAEIKKYVMAGLIRNITNTTIYTDADNVTQILGNTFDEVLTYFANTVNQAYVNDLRLKLKSYMK